MSMDRNMKWQAGKDYKRTSEVEVSKDFKGMIETIALAHLASGNSSDFMLSVNSLAKTQAKTEVAELTELVKVLVAQVQAQITNNSAVPTIE